MKRYCVVCGNELMGEGARQLCACSKCRLRYNGEGLAGVDRPELSIFHQLQRVHAQLQAAGIMIDPPRSNLLRHPPRSILYFLIIFLSFCFSFILPISSRSRRSIAGSHPSSSTCSSISSPASIT